MILPYELHFKKLSGSFFSVFTQKTSVSLSIESPHRWNIQSDKSLAMQIERHIKTLSRAEKEKIIKEPLSLSADPDMQAVSKEEFQLLYSKA